ncbi:MAG: tRNA (adenosine(37)-N6)-threonylcarbamoyltransferase complex dimerization subunit type 1 TsaB [Anaerolineae bacterium]
MILAIDTATRWAGLALHDGTAVLAESGWKCQNNHTIELSPAIAEMLTKAEITPAELTAVAVAIGPGSYTGLRVGLALAKGLALAHQIPLIGVSTLDVVTAAFGAMELPLLAVAEAGRTRVCAALYRWRDGRWQADAPPDIWNWPDLLAKVDEPVLVAGEVAETAVAQIRKADHDIRVASPGLSVRRAGLLAELGWQRYRAGDVDDGRTLAPIYLRDPAGKKTTNS